ncbi:glycosyltransferase [Alphaproteobacteria bacterium]|nr:glycosyltransferase [Alphaproteobacteria bacterium]
MRIAIVYQYKYPDSRGGGERRLFEVFKRFGCLIDWYVQCSDKNSNDSVIRYIPLSKGKFKYRSISETLLWTIMVLKIPFDKYDIIHIGQMPFFHIFTLIFKLNIYRLLRMKCPIITIDWWEYWGSYWYKFKFPLSIIGIVVEKFILRYSDNFIVISNKTKKDIERFTKGNISLIHNGIDLKLIDSAKIKKSANFIYFGRLEKHKRVNKSIEVFNELMKLNSKYTLEIIGDGSHKKALEALVVQLNLSSNVHFSGRLDDDLKMYSLVKGADCMLFFGVQEGGGSITLFEANACGTPMAHSHSKNGIDKDLITEDTGFFFNDFDKVKIAKKLHLYLQNPERKKAMSKACIDFVKDKDWNNISKKYKKYFRYK